MKAIHGGKAKTNRMDAAKLAGLFMGARTTPGDAAIPGQWRAARPRIAVWRRLRADDRTREPSRGRPTSRSGQPLPPETCFGWIKASVPVNGTRVDF
jgi:hypothetical protein